MVLDFYANLKFSNYDKVYVKGKEVEVSPSIICKYYKVLFYVSDEIKLLKLRNFNGIDLDSIMHYLTEGRGEWEREIYTNLPFLLNPRKQICVGTWIYKFMVRCVTRDETGVFFPHLVTDLCRAAKVPIKPLKPFHRPTTHVIEEERAQLYPTKSKIENVLKSIQKQLDELVEPRCYDSQTIEVMKSYVERCARDHGGEKLVWPTKQKRSQVQERCGMENHEDRRKERNEKARNDKSSRS
ncbi:hypothetical protein Gogos_019301 [Gossypium gossypioides]|uniref:Uncharacterized protein n=1 Tax=Gossypium gossypioides TaxID=34282 RepID=A0A7J9BH17_GOSGO|nr:hypothetical protein [Gossypium gossypioides]